MNKECVFIEACKYQGKKCPKKCKQCINKLNEPEHLKED
jgi:hypothetical protein